MEGNIPVPAESARQMAISAAEEVPRLREKGYKSSAESTERAISEVMSATAGNDGEYVSISADALSTVVADSNVFGSHKDAARSYLIQYGVWQG
jgi:hypothetical protein